MGFVEAIADSKKITQARYLVHGTKKKKEKNRTIILPFTLINFIISNLVIIHAHLIFLYALGVPKIKEQLP